MPTFSITFGSSKKSTAAASPKGKSRKASKTPTDTGTAIALAMAAQSSVLGDEVTVPGINRPLADLRQKANGVRPNGTFGAWYPACHEVAMELRPAATEWLKAQGQRPKGAAKKNSAEAELRAEIAALRAAIAAPAVAEGHTMEPAKPVEPLHILAEGQIVGVGDDLFEVRLDKNGKPFFRKA